MGEESSALDVSALLRSRYQQLDAYVLFRFTRAVGRISVVLHPAVPWSIFVLLSCESQVLQSRDCNFRGADN